MNKKTTPELFIKIFFYYNIHNNKIYYVWLSTYESCHNELNTEFD